jgi:long-chain acyl-CoA synthetase
MQTLIELAAEFYARGNQIAYMHRRGSRNLSWSYREVAQSAYQFARELETRGIGHGDKVFLWGENCPEWVVVFLGCLLRGTVVVPMDSGASVQFARRVCTQSEMRICICSRAKTVHISEWPSMVLEDLREKISHYDVSGYPLPEVTRDDIVEIVFTSGTTAEPKGVVISHRNVTANLNPLQAEIAKYIKYERVFHPLRFLSLLPLSHVFGQFLGAFIPQMLGAVVIFHDTMNPSEIIRTIKRRRVSVLVGVPRILETLKDKIERDFEAAGMLERFRRNFAQAEGEHFIKRWWRFRRIHNQFGWKFWAFICGGAALDADTEQFWSRLSFVMIQGYGLTETTSLVSVNHPFKLGKGSIGKTLPGREIKLTDNGEILVRGESIAAGYVQGSELNSVAGREGWFYTGDLGELDWKGNLYFRGRKKNVIVTPEGLNIYPEDLEAALRHQPEVIDCAVIALAKENNAEPCAVMILKGKELEVESVIKRTNLQLAEFQHIRRWYIWPDDDFPRTSTCKPRMNLIQEAVQTHFAGTERGGSSEGALAELISRITGRQVQRLASETNLASDLDLSSLDRVELLSALEDRLQIDLNESHFTSATTVGELERMLRQPVPRRTDYRYPRWAQNPFIGAVRMLVYYLVSWPATMIMACPRIMGREKMRQLRGPLLFIANHVTQVDVGFVLAALPWRYRHSLSVAMLGELLEGMRHPPDSLSPFRRCIEKISYALVVALFNVFPLPQQTGFRESLAFAGDAVDRGYSLLVFPEGRRTPDGSMSPFRAGIGMLANSLNLPIVPIKIEGLFAQKQARKKFARPGTITVWIGDAIRFEPGTSPEIIARDLENLMAGLGKVN